MHAATNRRHRLRGIGRAEIFAALQTAEQNPACLRASAPTGGVSSVSCSHRNGLSSGLIDAANTGRLYQTEYIPTSRSAEKFRNDESSASPISSASGFRSPRWSCQGGVPRVRRVGRKSEGGEENGVGANRSAPQGHRGAESAEEKRQGGKTVLEGWGCRGGGVGEAIGRGSGGGR